MNMAVYHVIQQQKSPSELEVWILLSGRTTTLTGRIKAVEIAYFWANCTTDQFSIVTILICPTQFCVTSACCLIIRTSRLDLRTRRQVRIEQEGLEIDYTGCLYSINV